MIFPTFSVAVGQYCDHAEVIASIPVTMLASAAGTIMAAVDASASSGTQSVCLR
jgi:hypothetical protein